MKELRASMDTIRKTAGEFIDSMTEVLQQLMREQQEKEHPEQAEEYQQAEFYDVPEYSVAAKPPVRKNGNHLSG